MRILLSLRTYRNTIVIMLLLLGFAYLLWQFPTLMLNLAKNIYAAEYWLMFWRWALIAIVAFYWPQLVKAAGTTSPSLAAANTDYYIKNLLPLRWRIVGALAIIELVFCMDIISRMGILLTK